MFSFYAIYASKCVTKDTDGLFYILREANLV